MNHPAFPLKAAQGILAKTNKSGYSFKIRHEFKNGKTPKPQGQGLYEGFNWWEMGWGVVLGEKG